MATIKDVARRAGVAPASVTRVLSGHPNVSEQMRERVLAAVEETGYLPDLMAAGLRRGSSKTIGVIVGDIINPILAEMVDRIESEFRDAGYSVLLANSHGDPARDVESVMLLHQRRVDALAAMCVDETSAELQRALRNLEIPLVLLDRVVDGVDAASAVLTDHYRSTYRLTEHLIEQGHQEILFVGGRRGATHPGRERLRGFTSALEDHGIEISPRLVRDSRPTPEFGKQVITELWDEGRLPTAIVIGPNPFVPGVLGELHARGVRVGVEVALACLDDVPVAALHQPPLTALYRDTQEVSQVASELLLSRLNGTSRYPRTVVLPMELRIRQSSLLTAQAAREAQRSAGVVDSRV